jgi:autotransporter-associated beta strand protein
VGSQTVTAADTVTSSITGTSGAIAVSAGTATHFTVTAPATAIAGTAINFTVTAQDASNNTATAYNGTVHFSGSDSAATLPANSTLTNGTGTFSATLRTAGSQTVTATDTVTSSTTGTSSSIAVNLTTGAIHLLGAPSCPSGSNWSNPACWDLNRAPVSGDDVVISGSAQLTTNDDLGAGVLLHSLAISPASGGIAVSGGPIGLQSGATIGDSATGSATDTIPGIALNGPASFTTSGAARTLAVSGAIGGAAGIAESGGGTLLLAAINTYSGTTTVSGGTLDVTGSLASSAVTVAAGGLLTGTGTVLSATVQSGGALSGNLTATAGATFAAGSAFDVTISSASTYSQLNGGTVVLTGGPTLNVTLADGFSPAAGTAFPVIPGTVSGTFGGLPNGATVPAGGAAFRVNYASVTLTALAPTVPAVRWPGLLALAMLLAAAASRLLLRRAAVKYDRP